MNRGFPIFLIILVLSAGGRVLADDPKSIFYFPASGTDAAVTINYQTGEKTKVLESMLGARPADCPKSAFWLKDNASLVHCDSGESFSLEKYTGPKKELFGAFSLIPQRPKPRGTDDPGPNIQKDIQN